MQPPRVQRALKPLEDYLDLAMPDGVGQGLLEALVRYWAHVVSVTLSHMHVGLSRTYV
jgi:hypothetical protein